MTTDVTPAADTDADAQTPEPLTQEQITALIADRDKWKGLSRKHENGEKTALTRITELEGERDAAVTRAEAAEETAGIESANALRTRIAGEKGVPVALLTGTTEEELTAAADELLAFKGVPADGQPTGDPAAPLTPQTPVRFADPAQNGGAAQSDEDVTTAFARQLFQV